MDKLNQVTYDNQVYYTYLKEDAPVDSKSIAIATGSTDAAWYYIGETNLAFIEGFEGFGIKK